MRWPFRRRLESAHGWGFVALGAAFLIGIAQELEGLNGTHAGFRWWWPTNWMAIPAAILVIGLALVVLPLRRERALPSAAPQAALPAVNPAEWEALCHQSGEFPGSKALVFELKHRFDHIGAYRTFGAFRCTVTDPDQITTAATGTARVCQYVPYYFPGAPPVRPGLYRSRWEGQLQTGAWGEIASGEHVISGPGIIVSIVEDRFESWKRIALIAALRVKVTNTTGTMIRLSSVGFSYDTEGKPALRTILSRDENLELDREMFALRERQHYGIPLNGHATVPAGESITGWVVSAGTRPDGGGNPSCTVAVEDELGNEYRATLPKREAKTYG